MTIHNPETFKENKPAGFDGTFDWDFLIEAFRRPKEKAGVKPLIQPMDLDCIVERKGKFLVFETKQPGKNVPQGQAITLNALVATGLFTVIILHAKYKEDVDGWQVWYKNKKEDREGDWNQLYKFVRRWFVWASGWPKE